MNLIICKQNQAHAYFNYLKDKRVHFSIFFIEDDPDEFASHFIKTEVLYLKNLKGQDAYYGPKEEADSAYKIAFLVQEISIISHTILLKYEKKLHLKCPPDYAYYFSYHSEKSFHRSWPIYLKSKPAKPKQDLVLINPYEKPEDNLIIMPLLRRAAQKWAGQGYTVHFYHYFNTAYALSLIFLQEYENKMFLMKENDLSLEHLFSSQTIRDLKESHVISLEMVLAESKRLKFVEIAEFLKISDFNKLLVPSDWNFPSLPDTSAREISQFKKQYDYLICIQLSRDDSSFFSEKHVQQLAALCEQQKIGIVTFHKNIVGRNILYEKDASPENSIATLAYCNLFFGTDLVCAHLAGLLELPNFILMHHINPKYNHPLTNSVTLLCPSQTGMDAASIQEIYDRIVRALHAGPCTSCLSTAAYEDRTVLELPNHL